MSNAALNRALKNKNDEWYTHYSDIENELSHYKDLIKGKSICCPADTLESNFWKYFYTNFNELGITRLTITSLNGKLYTTDDGAAIEERELETNGDFLNDEVLNIMRAHDVVITNPPFSLLCEFVKRLAENNIQFLLIVPETCYDNIRVFPLIKDNKVRTGFTKPKSFITLEGEKRLGNIQWLTNLPIEKENLLKLTKTYSSEAYKKYDNYDAINVDRVADIPIDYMGVMGVPITYITKHNPKLFKILGASGNLVVFDAPYTGGLKGQGKKAFINSKEKFKRIFIKRI